MLNPFDLDKGSGSYINLQKRILQRVRSANINEKIIELMQKTYEDALSVEKIVLSRAEKKHLQTQIFKLVFEELTKGLNNS